MRENNPSVSRFMGKVNTLIIGLTNILNNPIQPPTTKATHMGARVIPEITRDAIQTESEIRAQCKIIFIKY